MAEMLDPRDPQLLALFMQAIRQHESSGNYRAQGLVTKYGRATGAYQFLDSTWAGFGGYRSAAQAPPQIQDQKAEQMMRAYFDRFRDWRLVAIAWNGGAGAAQRALKGQAVADPVTGTNTFQYGNSVMGLMKKFSRGELTNAPALPTPPKDPSVAPTPSPTPAPTSADTGLPVDTSLTTIEGQMSNFLSILRNAGASAVEGSVF